VLEDGAVDPAPRTTRFRVWFQRGVSPATLDSKVWAGVKLAQTPRAFGVDAVDVTVVGNGSNLRRLLIERPDVFAALLELRPEDE
jgi:hypothetical protein